MKATRQASGSAPGNYDYHITVHWWPDRVFDQGEKQADEHDLRW